MQVIVQDSIVACRHSYLSWKRFADLLCRLLRISAGSYHTHDLVSVRTAHLWRTLVQYKSIRFDDPVVCVGADMYLLRVQSFRDWCKVGTSKGCIICSRSWRMPLLASKCHLSLAVYSPMRCARHQTAHNSCPVCLHSRADVFLSGSKQASNDVTSFV